MSDDDIPLYAMYGANHFAMDKAFCARMRATIKAGLESAPTGVVPTLGTQNPKYVSAEPWPQEPFMKLKLVAAISALAIPALAHAQQSGPQLHVPKPTKADAQNVVQIITSDKVKTQAYCDLTELEGQVKAVQQNDTKTVETLTKQAEALIDKLGPEYFKLMDGLEQVDPRSSEAREFMSILSELDKRCTK
jgi:hypothetical protein